MKQFIVKIDINPFCKKGEILTFAEAKDAWTKDGYFSGVGKCGVWLEKSFVENNPRFFAERIEHQMIRGWAHPNPNDSDKRTFCATKPINADYREAYLVFADEIMGWIYTEKDMAEFAEAYHLHRISVWEHQQEYAKNYIHLWKGKK